ncbi:hypothetical protein [Streptomyces sp. NPDC057702]|uniref:hypothetical protein n=1 Tax=unclassified Streptomyces TaxID=2593676 RepID=UPI0036C467D4
MPDVTRATEADANGTRMPAQLRHRPREEAGTPLPGARPHPEDQRRDPRQDAGPGPHQAVCQDPRQGVRPEDAARPDEGAAPEGEAPPCCGLSALDFAPARPAVSTPPAIPGAGPFRTVTDPAGAPPARGRADRAPSPADTDGSPEGGPLGPAGVAGEGCDVVTVPARQGIEAVDLLRLRESGGIGPVLHDDACDTLGFVVPAGTAAGWDVPGSACTRAHARGPRSGACTGRATTPPGAREATDAAPPAASPVRAAGWLVPPADAYSEATDPAVLRAALGEAARVIEAIDRCG